MSQIKKIGKRMEITPQSERLGGINPAELGDEAITLNQLKGYGSTKPYRKYVALLTQSSTSAPVATILENTIGAIAWSYSATGSYLATLSGVFIDGKTAISISPVIGQIQAYRNSTSVIEVATCAMENAVGVYSFPAANGILYETVIEIRIYQ